MDFIFDRDVVILKMHRKLRKSLQLHLTIAEYGEGRTDPVLQKQI